MHPPTEEGISPDRLLLDKSTNCTIFIPPSSDGIEPLNRLLDRLKFICNPLKLATDLGMEPVSLLKEMSRF
jgi:hypothetical protein